MDPKSPKPSLSSAVKAAKAGAAKPSESLQGRPLPQPIASSFGKATPHPYKVWKDGAAAAAAADAQEKASYYQKFAPVDDPKGIDFFGLAPDVMAKETAKSFSSPPVGESKGLGGRKQGRKEDSSYSGEDEEDSDEGDSDEDDEDEDEDATNEAEEDLSGEDKKEKGKQDLLHLK